MPANTPNIPGIDRSWSLSDHTTTQNTTFHAFLHSQLKKPYDSEAIWAFLFNRDWRETDSWICSELQAAGLEQAGVSPRLYLAANKITPVSLALTASAIGGVAL